MGYRFAPVHSPHPERSEGPGQHYSEGSCGLLVVEQIPRAAWDEDRIAITNSP